MPVKRIAAILIATAGLVLGLGADALAGNTPPAAYTTSFATGVTGVPSTTGTFELVSANSTNLAGLPDGGGGFEASTNRGLFINPDGTNGNTIVFTVDFSSGADTANVGSARAGDGDDLIIYTRQLNGGNGEQLILDRVIFQDLQGGSGTATADTGTGLNIALAGLSTATQGTFFRNILSGLGANTLTGNFSFAAGWDRVQFTFIVNGGVNASTADIIEIDAISNPEPGTLALFGLGVLALGGVVQRRRKRRAAQ